MIQSSGCLPKIYDCLRSKDYILLSFKENTEDTTIFYPNSTWTTGRNTLREHALTLEKKYDYYIFLDEDVVFYDFSQQHGFDFFETEISKYCPYISAPYYVGYYATTTTYIGTECQTTIWHDAMCVAYSNKAFNCNIIFPYVDKFDSESWWMSQYIMIILCSIYNKEVSLFNNINIRNENHSNYPKNNVFEITERYTLNNIPQKNGLVLIKNFTSSGIFKICDFLNLYFNLFHKLNIIDVGCAVGDLRRFLTHPNARFIGIDPLISLYKERRPNNCLDSYNTLYENAIGVEEQITTFNVTASLDTSSLYEFAAITTDITTNDKFYIPAHVKEFLTTVSEKIDTQTKTLNNIIEECKLNSDIIHILKVDSQGNDLNVIKSGHKYLKNVLFIIIESIYDDSPQLYTHGTTYSEDYAYLKEHGFEIVVRETLQRDDCDCLYYNTTLIRDFDFNWDKKTFRSLFPIQ